MPRSGPMASAVASALRATQTSAMDAGAVALAKRYAQLLDEAVGSDDEVSIHATLGPKLLEVLKQLGMTVAGRPAREGVTSAPVGNVVDELRARRERQRGGAGAD